MRILTLALALLAGTACGGGSSSTAPSGPEAKLCGRAYGSTMDSVKEMLTKAGVDMPADMPKKDEYVAKCMKLGLDEKQLKCMDPKIAGSDPLGCKKTLEPVKDKAKELNTFIGDAVKKGTQKDAKAKSE